MKSVFPKVLLPAAAALFSGVVLSSCAGAKLSPGPMVSQPPAKAIRVSQEFSVGDGILMKKFIYPSGVYQPVHEDAEAHYFVPPGEQIRVSDTGMSYGSQGGIYWEKGLDFPRKVYFTGNFGVKLPWKKEDLPVAIVR